MDKERVVEFWKSSAYRSGFRNFKGFFIIVREGIFPQFGSYLCYLHAICCTSLRSHSQQLKCIDRPDGALGCSVKTPSCLRHYFYCTTDSLCCIVLARDVRGVFNKVQDSSSHNNKCIKTTIMLFLIIMSVQWNAVFPALNKSSEACSIEIFVSTISNFMDMLLHYIVSKFNSTS